MKAPGFLKRISKASLVLLLAAVLVFASGLLVGWAYFTGRSRTVAAGAVPGPKSPTLVNKVESKLKTLTAKVLPKKSTSALSSGRALVPQTAATSQGAKPAAPASNAAPEPKENAAGAEPEAGAAPPPPPEYCLQIGSFTDVKLAKQLQADLKEKGYPATIFDGTDASYKTWHAVRMSKYADVDVAIKAAADFTSKEHLQAIVRPSGQL
jgi:cell division septation protein DedD